MIDLYGLSVHVDLNCNYFHIGIEEYSLSQIFVKSVQEHLKGNFNLWLNVSEYNVKSFFKYSNNGTNVSKYQFYLFYRVVVFNPQSWKHPYVNFTHNLLPSCLIVLVARPRLKMKTVQ